MAAWVIQRVLVIGAAGLRVMGGRSCVVYEKDIAVFICNEAVMSGLFGVFILRNLGI